MYCSSCGKSVIPGLSYCNHCGYKLTPGKKPEPGTISEASFNFLIAALLGLPIAGIGVLIGLLTVMKKELGMGDNVVAAVAFFAFFLLTISELGLLKLLLSSVKTRKDSKESAENYRSEEPAPRILHEAQPFDAVQPASGMGSSVTENTTRNFEPAYREPKAQ
ncbi:MAG TPA: hypothetical protein VGO50_14800 [Pyrinomonadaceae bacterium]|jgi:hypothetical protein|nr:hypothetical protein [Pyrinomonadaceae bacterium]